MQGITIGHGSIIGTNALVTKDIAPYSIVGGNPAKIIRKRFDEETIESLLSLAWWNWPVEMITEHSALIITGIILQLTKRKYTRNIHSTSYRFLPLQSEGPCVFWRKAGPALYHGNFLWDY